jgi:hypothetical protein
MVSYIESMCYVKFEIGNLFTFIYLFIFVGFELRAYTLSRSASPFFVLGIFF